LELAISYLEKVKQTLHVVAACVNLFSHTLAQ